jgi:general secretion pathway protein D
VPLLGSLPVLGRLFSSRLRDGQKTEIILSITPRLVRRLKRVEAQIEEFWSGTARTLRTHPFALRSVKESAQGTSLRLDTPPTAQPQQSPTARAEQTPALEQPSPSRAQPGQGLSLTWQGPSEAKVGQSFTIALQARSELPVVSAALQIAFDPAALELAQVVEGGFMKMNGATTSFTHRLDAPAGKLTVRVARSEPKGVAGEGDLVALTFRAKQPNARAQVQVVAASPVGAGNAPIAMMPNAPHGIALNQ